MGEIAVFIADYASIGEITSVQDLYYKSAGRKTNFANYINKIHDKFQDIFETYDITRLYFGNEFCEELIPDVAKVKMAYEKAMELGLAFTFVTPYVTYCGIKKLIEIFEFLNEYSEGVEIVCNDWGTCELISNHYKNLSIVLGRKLDKVYCDPRISEEEYQECYNKHSLEFLQRPNLFVPSYQEILRKYLVKRVEYDCLPQGMNLSTQEGTFALDGISIYLPFGYVTTGRMCMMRFLHQEGEHKYDYSGPCHHACKQYEQIMKKNIPIRRVNGKIKMNDTLQLLRKGNTVFYEVNNFSRIIQNNPGINRIVYQLELPI